MPQKNQLFSPRWTSLSDLGILTERPPFPPRRRRTNHSLRPWPGAVSGYKQKKCKARCSLQTGTNLVDVPWLCKSYDGRSWSNLSWSISCSFSTALMEVFSKLDSWQLFLRRDVNPISIITSNFDVLLESHATFLFLSKNGAFIIRRNLWRTKGNPFLATKNSPTANTYALLTLAGKLKWNLRLEKTWAFNDFDCNMASDSQTSEISSQTRSLP